MGAREKSAKLTCNNNGSQRLPGTNLDAWASHCPLGKLPRGLEPTPWPLRPASETFGTPAKQCDSMREMSKDVSHREEVSTTLGRHEHMTLGEANAMVPKRAAPPIEGGLPERFKRCQSVQLAFIKEFQCPGALPKGLMMPPLASSMDLS